MRRLGKSAPAQPPKTVEIEGIVNASDPGLPLISGGLMAVRLPNPNTSSLVVQLNRVIATEVRAGVDAEGCPALLVNLDSSQPCQLLAGSLAVRVIRTLAGGTGVAGESQSFEVQILPGLASPPVVDLPARQVRVEMALPVLPASSASILLIPTGPAAGRSRRIPCLPLGAPETVLTSSISEVDPGTYLLSVAIDGVASLLDVTSGEYSGPLVSVPGPGATPRRDRRARDLPRRGRG